MKRGYFIHGGDPQGGFAVVATSLREARRIVYRAGEIEAEWIDICGWWCRNAKVEDLPMGVIEDIYLGLRRGVFSYLCDSVCDICGETATLVECNGYAICMQCEENETTKRLLLDTI